MDLRPKNQGRPVRPSQVRPRTASTQQPECLGPSTRSASRRPGTPERDRSGFTRDQRATIMKFRQGATVAFAVLLVLGFFVGLLVFLRPSTSTVEKRTLTEFPAPNAQALLDGDFFSDVSLWYSDTYPLREPLVAADLRIQELYGIQPSTMMVGAGGQSDQIPDLAVNAVDEGASASATAAAPREPVEPPSEQAVQEEVQGNIMSGLFVQDGAAYSMYYFSQESVDLYCDAIARAAEQLDGVAKVYAVVAPTNAAAVLDQATVDALGGADQRQALAYFESLMGDKVGFVPTLDVLRDHNDEYIYFRTDHHWTARGAYYVWESLARQMGIEPTALDAREKQEFGPFLGSFYNELNVAAMADNPDVVEAWTPKGTNQTNYVDHDGNAAEGQVITDVSGWNESSLYMAFISGDQPFMTIENPQVNDGSSCLVVKDSYGCAFVPHLVDSFQTVYVIDYRYSDRNIVDFVRENGVQNVVFLNNISIAGTLGVAETMQSLI